MESLINSIQKSTQKSESSCGCLKVSNPVCGVDNKTYINECMATCKDVDLKYEAACIGDTWINNSSNPSSGGGNSSNNGGNNPSDYKTIYDLDVYDPINPEYV